MKSVSIEEMLAQIEEVLEKSETPSDDDAIRAAPTGPVTPIIPRQNVEVSIIADASNADASIAESSIEELIEKLEQQTEESIYQECIESYTRLIGEPPDSFISNMLKVYASMSYRHEQLLLNLLQNSQPENPEVERRYQNAVERHIEAYGEPPNPFQSQTLRLHATEDVRIEQQMMIQDFHRRHLQEDIENRHSQHFELGSSSEFQPLSETATVHYQPICPAEREQLDRYGELFELSREEGESDEAYRERIRQRAYPHLN